jgi:hypothetical protein
MRFGKEEVHADHFDSVQRTPFPGRGDSGVRPLVATLSLAYEQVAEILAGRSLELDPSRIWRGVQAYTSELNQRCRPHLKPTNQSYCTAETYIKVKGEDKYLYRAVDSTGQTIAFPRTAKRVRTGQPLLPQGSELSRQGRA